MKVYKSKSGKTAMQIIEGEEGTFGAWFRLHENQWHSVGHTEYFTMSDLKQEEIQKAVNLEDGRKYDISKSEFSMSEGML